MIVIEQGMSPNVFEEVVRGMPYGTCAIFRSDPALHMRRTLGGVTCAVIMGSKNSRITTGDPVFITIETMISDMKKRKRVDRSREKEQAS